MLPRYCSRLSHTSRLLLFKKFSSNKKCYECNCVQTLYLPFRLLSVTTPLKVTNKSNTTSGNPLNFSAGPSKDLNNANLNKNTLLSEELLEKHIASLSSDIYQKNRVYRNDLERVVNKVKELNFSSKKQGLLLIKCCSELMPDETPSFRLTMVEDIWNAIKSHTVFDVEHYNELLRVYIANNRTVTASTFVQQMSPVKPNMTTYELILRALGEAGDINQATEVLSNMKAQNLPATAYIFNSLIICQGKAGNLQNIKEILTMMMSLKLEKSVDTYTAIARSLAWNKKNESLLEEMENANKNGIQFTEKHIMEIVKTLAVKGFYGPIPQVLQYLPQETLKTPSISPYMQSVSTSLVFQNHPIAALEIYKCLPLPSFGPKDDKGLHGRSLVRDCVKASMPSSIIAVVTQELMASGRNTIAIQNAAEAALQLGKVPLALDLFTRMKQLGMPLRQHYFWPILMHSSKTYGQKGIMNTLSTMMTMDVKPDYDTIMEYVLPYVSFTSPQNLMKKFTEAGLSVSTVLTPMMETLLNTGQVRAASEICEIYQAKVDAEKLLKSLLKGYLTSMDAPSTVHILEDIVKKALDKNRDWTGRFLCVFIKHKKLKEDLSDFTMLLKELRERGLKISTPAADYCINWLPDRLNKEHLESVKEQLIQIIDETIIDDSDIFFHQMPHPKHMKEDALKAHLTELDSKNMNTRGVLRKLLQEYCRDGNLTAAREVVERCQKEGIFLSAGMKAAIFDLHVKLGELDLAEIALADLNKSSPNFTLDEYKVIDFATLMVYRKHIDKAFDMIEAQSKKRRVIGGQNISKNCWRLLDAMAAHGTPEETNKMFDTLTSLRYCKPNNVLLGPLIRVHLKNDNFIEAVNEFQRIANKYNKTPLKHELLCKILSSLGDGGSEENFLVNQKTNSRLNKLIQTVLNVSKKVHGAGDVQLTLIAALADVGYVKSLRKLLLDPTVKLHPDAILRRCERFADEKKVKALENIAECSKNLRYVNAEEIYDLILDVHQRDDNCQEALILWQRMQGTDIIPSNKFVKNLYSLLKSNKKPIPAELSVLFEKDAKTVSN